MERDIRLDWQAIVSEAVKRRKEQRLTQKELALIANVSKPTVNKFEQQKENITLESVFAILKVLGLLIRES